MLLAHPRQRGAQPSPLERGISPASSWASFLRQGAAAPGSLAVAASPLRGAWVPRCSPVVAVSPAPAAAAGKKPEKPLAKTLIGGSVTVVFEAFGGGHFLEFLKISKQTSGLTYPEIVRNVTQHKGIVGVLDGFMPWGFAQSVTKGAVFAWGHATAKQAMYGNTILSDNATEVLAGGIGGGVQGIFMSPLLLLKTRVMTDSAFRTSGTAWETTMSSARIGGQVIAREGAIALMKGAGVFSFKRFCDWTTRYFFVQVVEGVVRGGDNERKLSKPVQMLCALGGGTLSALATVPIDVMVATVQDAGKAGKKVSIIEVYKNQMASGGLKGTLELSTRGLVSRVAHVALTTLLMKTITSFVYDKIVR